MSFDSVEFDSVPCSPDDVNSSSAELSYSMENRLNLSGGNKLKSNDKDNVERISVYDSLYSKRRGILPRSKLNSENKMKSSPRGAIVDKRSYDYGILPKDMDGEHVYMNLPIRKNPYTQPEKNWYDSDSPPLAASIPYGSDNSPTDRSSTSGISGSTIIPPQPKSPAPTLNRQMSSGSYTSVSRSGSIASSRRLSSDICNAQPDGSESTRKYSSPRQKRTQSIDCMDSNSLEVPSVVPPLNLSLLEVPHREDSDSDNASPTGSMNNYYVMEDSVTPRDKSKVKSPPKRMWSFENGEESKLDR